MLMKLSRFAEGHDKQAAGRVMRRRAREGRKVMQCLCLCYRVSWRTTLKVVREK